MNPIAYCVIASCSEKDWEVLSTLFVVLVGLVAVGLSLDYILTIIKSKREKDMK